MQAVLGIDAAWTLAQPSGVALAVKGGSRWHLAGVAPSYQRFIDIPIRHAPPEIRPLGSRPDPAALLATAARIAGGPVDLVAIDMPMSLEPITSRRPADNAVSRAYGARKCSTHIPSALRPGLISDELRAGFASAGYPLLTSAITSPGLIEVYPHPALVELATARERLPYKISKVRTYWPHLRPDERRLMLLAEWRQIVVLLTREIDGVDQALPSPSVYDTTVALKAYEDSLDAVVCAWVAICALEGQAQPSGDRASAIWIPRPGATLRRQADRQAT